MFLVTGAPGFGKSTLYKKIIEKRISLTPDKALLHAARRELKIPWRLGLLNLPIGARVQKIASLAMRERIWEASKEFFDDRYELLVAILEGIRNRVESKSQQGKGCGKEIDYISRIFTELGLIRVLQIHKGHPVCFEFKSVWWQMTKWEWFNVIPQLPFPDKVIWLDTASLNTILERRRKRNVSHDRAMFGRAESTDDAIRIIEAQRKRYELFSRICLEKNVPVLKLDPLQPIDELIDCAIEFLAGNNKFSSLSI